MKKIALILILFPLISQSQIPNFSWAAQIGGADKVIGRCVDFDGNGNVYSAGNFEGVIDLDPGTGVSNVSTSVHSDGDLYFQKLDGQGNFIWGFSLGGDSANILPLALTVDNNDDVLVAGVFFGGNIDFDPGTAAFPLSSSMTASSVFILKIKSDGSFAWAKVLYNTSNDWVYSITNNQNNELFITGLFSGSTDFDPGIASYVLPSFGSHDGFLLKLDSDGDFNWVKQYGNISFDGSHSVELDDVGNIYVAGFFQGTADFDPGLATSNLTSQGGSDAFVQKLNGSGNFIWAKGFGGADNDKARSIEFDVNGDLWLTGEFEGTADFDPSSSTSNLSSAGSWDALILKIDTSGNFIWAGALGDQGIDIGYSIAPGQNGNVFVLGSFEETPDFNPAQGTFLMSSNGLSDIFILELDTYGDMVWASQIGGIGYEGAYSVSSNNANELLLTGYFNNSIDCDPTSGVEMLTSNGGQDAFVLKLSEAAVGIQEVIETGSFRLYPNPTSGAISVESTEEFESVSWKVFDCLGRTVSQGVEYDKQKAHLSINASSGIYFVEIVVGEKKAVYRVLKN